MQSPEHPVWRLSNIVAIGILAYFILHLFATEFDETEIKSLTALVITLAGAQELKSFIQGQLTKRKK